MSYPSIHTDPPTRAVLIGTVCGLLSAVLYTVANTFLRAVADVDPIWVSTVKAVPTVLLIGPWLLLRRHRNERVFPVRKVLVSLVLASLVGQLGGNVLFQYSLGVIGIAMGVSLTLGTIIVAGAVLGRLFLGEIVTLRMLAALGFLIAAFGLLAMGAPQAYDSVVGGDSPPASFWAVAMGVAAATGAGVAYAVLGVVLRYGVSGRSALSATMFIVGGVGVVSLGTLSGFRLGWSGMETTSQAELGVMLLAGICNTLAFLALTKALQVTTLVFVNALNATQATMAAIAGVLFFHEAFSFQLAWGVALTIVGLLLMREGGRRGGIVKAES